MKDQLVFIKNVQPFTNSNRVATVRPTPCSSTDCERCERQRRRYLYQ